MTDDKSVTWGRFTWHDNVSDHQDEAIEFYTQLLGWEIEDLDMGPAGVYKMWKAGDDSTMGGFGDKPMPEAPNAWLGYVQVENADETLARATSHGGTALSPVIEIPDIGRAVTIQDPQGGVFGVFQPLSEPFSTAPDWQPPRLAVCWNELMSADVPAATAFYTEVLGWHAEVKEMVPGMDYTIFTAAEGMMVAGLMQSPPPHGDMTAWMAHIYVDDLEQSLDKARTLGAKVHAEPQTIPGVGSFSLIEDPLGAFVNLFQPSPPA
jgi:uncharacterized protein